MFLLLTRAATHVPRHIHALAPTDVYIFKKIAARNMNDKLENVHESM